MDSVLATGSHVETAHELLNSIEARLEGPMPPQTTSASGMHAPGGPGLLDSADRVRTQAEHLLPRLQRILNAL
jgi:hypothetical protein